MELADVIARSLLIGSEQSLCFREIPKSWKKVNVILILEEEDLGSYKLASLASEEGNPWG